MSTYSTCVVEMGNGDGITIIQTRYNTEKLLFEIERTGNRTRDLTDGDTIETVVQPTHPQRSSMFEMFYYDLLIIRSTVGHGNPVTRRFRQ